MDIQLRPAEADDATFLFQWANDPDVRKMSLSPDPILWESHQRWFNAKLASDACWMFVAVDKAGQPVGQIRFDVTEEGCAEVDVHTDPDRRGQGIGLQLILLGVQRLLENSSIDTVTALIQCDNAGSRKAFERAGFQMMGAQRIADRECVRMLFPATDKH